MTSKFVSRGAEKYDAYMGRWSRKLAPLFLDFAGLGDGERVLDAGCGTGSLTLELSGRANFKSVEAIDYEQQFVDAARDKNTDPRINFRHGDACNLQFADGSFDRVLSMLVLHFVSDADRAIAEMRRVLRPGGIAAATVWDNFGGQTATRMFWDTVAAAEPSAGGRRDASLIRPMTRPGELAAAFAKAGFVDIAEDVLTVRMDFANFDDYWIPTQAGQGTIAGLLESLPPANRARVEAAIKAAYLCGQPDGPRSFVSIAWAVRGRAPRG